jgi:REP element-mobilizing transposase RayT
MARTARATEAKMVYHVLNRGNGRMRLFHKPGDYEAFEKVLAEGIERYAVELLTTAARLGLGFTLRGPGRPRKVMENQ